MITLTDSAAVKVRQLLADEGAEDLALRVAVRPGGCSGFSYEMFFDGDIAADDNQASYGDDGFVKVVVDPASAQLLEGATLDYKDGLDQSGVGQTVDHPRQGDRFNFNQFSKRSLPNSLIAAQIDQHPPLQRRDPAIADTRVEVAAKQPRGIIEQESDRL